MCCALERTLAYAYTGNAKVLSRALLEPLFITQSLLQHGLPTINTEIVRILSTKNNRVIIADQQWPTTKSGPITCSKGAHILRYGMASWMVSTSSVFGVFRFPVSAEYICMGEDCVCLPADAPPECAQPTGEFVFADVEPAHPRTFHKSVRIFDHLVGRCSCCRSAGKSPSSFYIIRTRTCRFR